MNWGWCARTKLSISSPRQIRTLKLKTRLYKELDLQNKIDRELALLETWVIENPTSQLFIRLAEIYRDMNRIDDAAQVLERALSFHSHNIQVRVMLAEMYEEQGRSDQALDALRQAAGIIFSQRQVFTRLGRYLPRYQAQCSQLADALANIAAILGKNGIPDYEFEPRQIDAILDKLENLRKAANIRSKSQIN
jgi:predicted Zn-dependent protease